MADKEPKSYYCPQCRVPHPHFQHVKGAPPKLEVVRPAVSQAVLDRVKGIEIGKPKRGRPPVTPTEVGEKTVPAVAGPPDGGLDWSGCPHCAERRRARAEAKRREREKNS
jgi:hypothetical protein